MKPWKLPSWQSFWKAHFQFCNSNLVSVIPRPISAPSFLKTSANTIHLISQSARTTATKISYTVSLFPFLMPSQIRLHRDTHLDMCTSDYPTTIIETHPYPSCTFSPRLDVGNTSLLRKTLSTPSAPTVDSQPKIQLSSCWWAGNFHDQISRNSEHSSRVRIRQPTNNHEPPNQYSPKSQRFHLSLSLSPSRPGLWYRLGLWNYRLCSAWRWCSRGRIA